MQNSLFCCKNSMLDVFPTYMKYSSQSIWVVHLLHLIPLVRNHFCGCYCPLIYAQSHLNTLCASANIHALPNIEGLFLKTSLKQINAIHIEIVKPFYHWLFQKCAVLNISLHWCILTHLLSMYSWKAYLMHDNASCQV